MITNALMSNSELSLYQEKGNLELSAAESIFPETKKPTGFPSCLQQSLPLLRALLHRQCINTHASIHTHNQYT